MLWQLPSKYPHCVSKDDLDCVEKYEEVSTAGKALSTIGSCGHPRCSTRPDASFKPFRSVHARAALPRPQSVDQEPFACWWICKTLQTTSSSVEKAILQQAHAISTHDLMSAELLSPLFLPSALLSSVE